MTIDILIDMSNDIIKRNGRTYYLCTNCGRKFNHLWKVDDHGCKFKGTDTMIKAVGYAYDATTHDWTQRVEYVAKDRMDAIRWMNFNRDWFKNLHIED